MHCVDLGESFPTRFYLQKSASIQPKTSPSKFGENSIHYSFASLVVTHLSYNITWVAAANILAVMIANAHSEDALTLQAINMYSMYSLS